MRAPVSAEVVPTDVEKVPNIMLLKRSEEIFSQYAASGLSRVDPQRRRRRLRHALQQLRRRTLQ